MTPVKELALLRRTETSFYGEKLILTAIGLVAPPLLSTLLNVFGLRFPIAVPLIASLVRAVGLFVLPNLDIHGKAKAARLEFNHVLTGFIDLVALERRAGSGPRQVQASQIMRGQSPQIDTAAARTAAAAYLHAAGVEGSVSITGPTTLSVHVTIVYQPKFLGTAGIGPKTVSGDATILLSRVVNGAPR